MRKYPNKIIIFATNVFYYYTYWAHRKLVNIKLFCYWAAVARDSILRWPKNDVFDTFSGRQVAVNRDKISKTDQRRIDKLIE